MKDENKTKKQLIKKLADLRKRLSELEKSEVKRKKAEEERNRILNLSYDLICIAGMDGYFKYVNQAWERTLGYTSEELLSKPFLDFIHHDDHNKNDAEVEKLSKGEQTVGFENRYIHKDGSIRTISWTATAPEKEAQIYCIGRDITEHKKVEEALRESEVRFRNIFESDLIGMLLWNANGDITDANDAFLNTVGYSPEDILSGELKWRQLTPPEYFDSDTKKLKELAEKGVIAPFEKEYIHKSGRKIPIVLGAATFPGTPTNGVAFIIDITERKQVEEKMEHLSRVLRATRNVNQLIVREKDRDRLLQCTCENLTETHGYYNAWIALMDETNRPMAMVEAGIGKDFLLMVEKLKRGELTACGKKALTQSEIVVTENPPSSCTDCPLVAHYAGRGAMCVRLEHAGKIYGLLSVSVPTYLITNEEEHTLLQEIAEDVAFALYNMVLEKEHKKAEDQLRKNYALLQKTLGGTVHALASTVGKRDPFTQSHQLKVTKLACCIAEKLHLSKDRIKGLRFAGLLHDIGKISVPAEILSKPGRLTNAEYRIIKTHAQHAYDILKDIEFPWPIADIVLQHHERLDGSGYPQELKDDEILLEAKILAVADVVEAMSSHRPYRPAPGVEKALDEIKKNRGILYEPDAVDVCLKLFKEKGFKFE